MESRWSRIGDTRRCWERRNLCYVAAWIMDKLLGEKGKIGKSWETLFALRIVK